jgi:hypothetical protein
MAGYISSNANRFYTALESGYGQLQAVQAENRIPAVKLAIEQQLETARRKDKTGSRTFGGTPPGGWRKTDFELRTYLTSWDRTGQPGYGPLFQAALGGTPLEFTGGTVAAATSAGRLQFGEPHVLAVGQGVAYAGEIRFVAAHVDANTVQLNAPFTQLPAAGAPLGAALTYVPATELPSVSLYDYWSPETAVQRALTGAAVDELEVLINADYHEVRFSGLAQDVIDSASFAGAVGQLTQFPEEPALDAFDYSIVPGNLGQAWIGASPTQMLTITNGSVVLKNQLEMRRREFGARGPRAISPGQRTVTASFELFSQDDDETRSLYQAARQQSPVSVMFQLGEAEGQVMGVYLKSVIPEVPEFDDSENRLQWKFRASRAQGTVDDEIAVAFA